MKSYITGAKGQSTDCIHTQLRSIGLCGMSKTFGKNVEFSFILGSKLKYSLRTKINGEKALPRFHSSKSSQISQVK